MAKAAGGTGDYGKYGIAGKKLKARSGWSDDNGHSGNGTDDFGFSALPGGDRNYSGGSFGNVGYHGNWWTATKYTDVTAYGRTMLSGFGDYVHESYSDKGFGFSVRCVAD